MQEILKKIIEDTRTKHFQIRNKSDEEIFYDLCFCLLAPQTKFAYNKIATGDLTSLQFYKVNLSENELQAIVKSTRFFRLKAKRLLQAKESFQEILKVVKSDMSDVEKREWLVENVNGLGMKAASHFLRNLGNESFAIIDTHIIKFMNSPKPRNKNEYLALEQKFIEKAKEMGITPAELDMSIWKEYSGTAWKDYSF